MVGEDKSYYFFFDRLSKFQNATGYNYYHMHTYHVSKNKFLEFPLFYSAHVNTMHFIRMDHFVNDFTITGTTIPFNGPIAFRLKGDMSQTYAHHLNNHYTYRHNIFTLGDYDKKVQKIPTEFIYNQKYTSKRTYKYTLSEYTSK
jgi:hypothetical protein